MAAMLMLMFGLLLALFAVAAAMHPAHPVETYWG